MHVFQASSPGALYGNMMTNTQDHHYNYALRYYVLESCHGSGGDNNNADCSGQSNATTTNATTTNDGAAGGQRAAQPTAPAARPTLQQGIVYTADAAAQPTLQQGTVHTADASCARADAPPYTEPWVKPTQGEIRCAMDPAAQGGDYAVWNGARKCHDPTGHSTGTGTGTGAGTADAGMGCCYEVWYRGSKSVYIDASARHLTPLSAIANFLTTSVVLEDRFKDVVGWMRWATELGAMTNLDQRNFFGQNAGTGTSLANGIAYGS